MKIYAYYRYFGTADPDKLKKLRRFGCDDLFQEQNVFGNAVIKPQLERMFARATSGDLIVVNDLSDVCLSLSSIWSLFDRLKSCQLNLVSLSSGLDTRERYTAFEVTSCVRAYEDLCRQRWATERSIRSMMQRSETAPSLMVPKRKRGRPSEITPEQLRMIIKLRDDGYKITQIAEATGFSRQTVHNRLRKLGHYKKTGPTSELAGQIEVEEYLALNEDANVPEIKE